MTASNQFVVLRSGLTVPLEPLRLAWDLEQRGISLGLDGEALTAGPRERLNDDDRQAIKRWRNHLVAVVEYAQAARH